MNLISFLMLVLIPVSLVYAVITGVKMHRGNSSTTPKYYRDLYKPRLLVSAGMLALCVAVLFFSGKFYSLSMTFQVPPVYVQHKTPGSKDITLTQKDIDFTGTKALTRSWNYGLHTNYGQQVFEMIDGFFAQKLFHYTDQYIPEQYRASSASDIGYFVFAKHYATEGSTRYTNGASAWIHKVDVTLCNNERILAEKTFSGGLHSSTTGPDILGPSPDKQVSEWVAEQLARFASE